MTSENRDSLPARTDVFLVSGDYIEWAHGPGADSGFTLATELCNLPRNKRGQVAIPINRPDLLFEVQDVAELYVGGEDTDLRAARVLARVKRLREALEKR